MFASVAAASSSEQTPDCVPALDRDVLPQGLVFCAVVAGNCFVDLITGLRSSQANALEPTNLVKMRNARYSSTSYGTTRPGEQVVALQANGQNSSGQAWAAQATKLDKLATAGTLLCLGGITGSANQTHTMVASIDSATYDHGYAIGIDDAAFVGYGLVLVDNEAVTSTFDFFSPNDALSHDPRNTLHFFGAGWDATTQYFYYKGLRSTTVSAKQPTLQATRTTYILRGPKVAMQSGFTSAVALAMAWNRVLSATEYNTLWQNPWVGFR